MFDNRVQTLPLKQLPNEILYSTQLMHLQQGVALCEPGEQSPGAPRHARVGDVGYLHLGSFNCLFNIFDEKPAGGDGLPPGFVPISPELRATTQYTLDPVTVGDAQWAGALKPYEVCVHVFASFLF